MFVRRSTSLLRLERLDLVKGPASESEHNRKGKLQCKQNKRMEKNMKKSKRRLR